MTDPVEAAKFPSYSPCQIIYLVTALLPAPATHHGVRSHSPPSCSNVDPKQSHLAFVMRLLWMMSASTACSGWDFMSSAVSRWGKMKGALRR